uniref:Uncharacterized protein n=1 Tax=Tanacetum cinerariifolium TaxID=118510 RepID=A0A699JBC7_TANCI|nr:hypothetical protein [Tanacetum cinerariifolium]
MSQPPNEPDYFTHLLNSNPPQYSSSPNQSNPSTPGSQNSNSSSQPFPPFGTQMSPDQAYRSQLAYHQHQPYGFQNFANPKKLHHNIFHHNPHNHNIFHNNHHNHHSKYHKPKIPVMVGVEKKRGNNPLSIWTRAAKRAITRWNRNEEILIAETWIEHSQDANIGKDQQDNVY